MRCLRFLLNMAVLCLFLCLISPVGKADQAPVKNIAAPAAKPSPDVRSKQIQSSSKSPKINFFLAELERAGSIEDVARVFTQSKFNQGELKQLEQEINKAVYLNKLDHLKQKLALKPKMGGIQKRQGKKSSLQKLNADLKRTQDLKISRHNQQAVEIITGRKRSPGRRITASASSLKVAVPRMMSTDMAAPVSSVDIREIIPGVGIIGQRLTIRGEGFGPNQGEVTIVVGIPGSDDRQAFGCPVQSWSGHSIVVTIPLDCENMVAAGEGQCADGRIGSVVAWIFLNPAGDDPGAFKNMEVALDPARFAPRIESLNPGNDISPGQDLIILGSNLHIGQTRHAVTFNFGRERIEVYPDRYEADFLQVRLPADIEGLFQTIGTVEVKNMTGLTDFRSITFVPIEEIVEIVSEELKAHCGLPVPRIFCFIGYAYNEILHDWTLTNGWVVEDSWLDTWERGINSGAYYLNQPTPGSTLAASTIKVWADAYSWVTTKEHLFLKGAKGTFDRSH